MDGAGKNTKKLKDAGLVTDAPLPEEYGLVLEELSESEVEMLIRLKGRLDQAEKKHMSAGGDQASSLSACFVL